MKLGEARKEANELTGLLSTVCRQLLLAGVAIVWLFSGGGELDAREVNVPDDLEWALFVLLIGLAADFLQYLGQAIGTRYVYRKKNEKWESDKAADAGVPEPEVSFPDGIRRWGDWFWRAKAAAVLGGYALLLVSVGNDVF